MSKEYENQVTSAYKKESILKIIKRILGYIIYCINQDIISKNLFLKFKNPILFNSSFAFIKYYIKVEFKRWYLFGKNSYFSFPIKNENYVLFPLHLIPESSTLVHAPFYMNELFCIEQLSKSLPVGWKLYVKEHQVMAGERDFKFYKKVNSLPNVKMVQFNYFNDPKPWILNSKGVVTITGTTAFEAVMLGKKAVVFGDLPFNVINGITRVTSFETLPTYLKEFKSVDNIHSCAAYLATIKKIGAEFRFLSLLTESEEILKGNKIENDEFKNEIDKLIKFYEKAYAYYLNNEQKEC
jgi:hypothetical protein